MAGPRPREAFPGLAFTVGDPLSVGDTECSQEWAGPLPVPPPPRCLVSGMGKEVSGPQGQKGLATRSVVAESLLLGPSQVTGFWGAHQTPTVAPVQAWAVIGLCSDSSGTSMSFVLGPFFLLQIQQHCSSNVSRHSPFPGRAMSLPCTPGPPGSSNSVLSRAPVPLLCET